MVNYTTRIIMKLTGQEEPVPGRARVPAMMEILVQKDFTFTRSGDSILAESTSMEAQAAKQYLLRRGFRADEFQVFLEYTRQWGVL